MPKTRQQRRAHARNPLKQRRRGRIGFLVFLTVVAAVGGALIWNSKTNPPPLTRGAIAGEHWHASYRIDICGARMENYPQVEGEVHSHGDGFMHIHPSSPEFSGENATLGNFLRVYQTEIGVTAKGKRFIAFPDGKRHEDGKKCPDGKRYDLVVLVNGKTYKGDPATLVPHEGDKIVIRFGPSAKKKTFTNPYAKLHPEAPPAGPQGPAPAPDAAVPPQQQIPQQIPQQQAPGEAPASTG